MRFGVFIYDGTEPIDLATYGVLSMARRIRPDIQICTIAPRPGIVQLTNGLRVIPDHDVSSAPTFDVLIVAGGGPGGASRATLPTLCSSFAVTLTIRCLYRYAPVVLFLLPVAYSMERQPQQSEKW